MAWVVVEITGPGVLPEQVRTFGPYDTEDKTEMARRRRHLSNVLESSWHPPHTCIAKIEGAI